MNDTTPHPPGLLTAAPPQAPSLVWWRWLGGAWGVAGVLWLLGRAVWRMALVAQELDPFSLPTWQQALGVLWVAFMAYSEGYRAMQLGFAPRVVRRAQWMTSHGSPWLVIVAPLFCMGLVFATRRRLVVSWSVLTMILVLIFTVRLLEQPWRGLIDAGVVVGLGWGVVAIVSYTVLALLGRQVPGELDLPDRQRRTR